MSLTRKMLKAMGIEEEKIDQIIEAHSETVDSLKADRDTYKEDAEKLKTVQKELDELKAKGDDGWKEKHDKLKGEFDKYKGDIEAKEIKAKVNNAVRSYLESKSITGDNLDLAMMACESIIASAELDGEKLKDTTALDTLVDSKFKRLVTHTTTKGANTANPPANNGTGTGKTRDEILAIKDGSVRRAEMAKNPHLFGLTDN